jgi:hypothetical protein
LKYTLQSIKDRILFFVREVTSETRPVAKEKILAYINHLKDMLLDCVVCKSPMSESGKNCIRIQEMIGWALEKLRKIEKKK